MSWIAVIVLALASFAAMAFAFRLRRELWTSLLAALALGLAGYALQASPHIPASPTETIVRVDDSGWGVVDARKEMIAARYRSGSDKVLIADALARRGQYSNAAAMLRGAADDNPNDAEAWLALGNALLEHADGVLTPAALYSYRRASVLIPASPAPGYFLGLSLIRQGRMMEARQVWTTTLEASDPDDEARPLLEERLMRLDSLLSQAGQLPPPETP